MVCFICRGRHFFLGNNNVTSRVFRIIVDPLFSVWDGQAVTSATCVVCFLLDVLCVSYWILTGVGYGSVLVFSMLDINSG